MGQAIEGLNQELASLADGTAQRINCTPENIEQGLARLVLSLIELLRRLLERQAIRRMEGGALDDQQIEEMGLALMKLEQKIREPVGSIFARVAARLVTPNHLGTRLTLSFLITSKSA